MILPASRPATFLTGTCAVSRRSSSQIMARQIMRFSKIPVHRKNYASIPQASVSIPPGSASNLSFCQTIQPSSPTSTGTVSRKLLLRRVQVSRFHLIFSTNTSPAGGLTFASCTGLALAARQLSARGWSPRDFDGDGRPDIATADLFAQSRLRKPKYRRHRRPYLFFREYRPRGGQRCLFSGRCDSGRDNKPDLAAINQGDGTMSLFRNTSLSGTIGFDPGIVLPCSKVTPMAARYGRPGRGRKTRPGHRQL